MNELILYVNGDVQLLIINFDDVILNANSFTLNADNGVMHLIASIKDI